MKNSDRKNSARNNWSQLCNSKEALFNHIQSKLKTHQPQTYRYTTDEGVKAGVLIPIFFKENQAHLLFTLRTETLEHHRGQISFPGGRMDQQDQDLMQTALRETEEEVGIRQSDIKILGGIDYFLTTSNFLIRPFVGVFDYPYSFRINKAEIQRLIEVPLLHLLGDDNFEIKPYEINGMRWKVHYYTYHRDIIWGVTGFLLSDFLSLVFGLKRNHFIKSPA